MRILSLCPCGERAHGENCSGVPFSIKPVMSGVLSFIQPLPPMAYFETIAFGRTDRVLTFHDFKAVARLAKGYQAITAVCNSWKIWLSLNVPSDSMGCTEDHTLTKR